MLFVSKWLICLCVSAFLFFSTFQTASAAESPCKEFIETRSTKELAKQLGKPQKWVAENYRINLLDKEPGTGKGKGKVVGKLRPGSRAEVLKAGANDYQVKSPLDGSVGWISRSQVRCTLLLDKKTLKLCR